MFGDSVLTGLPFRASSFPRGCDDSVNSSDGHLVVPGFDGVLTNGLNRKLGASRATIACVFLWVFSIGCLHFKATWL
jgi:hypothetical protein